MIEFLMPTDTKMFRERWPFSGDGASENPLS